MKVNKNILFHRRTTFISGKDLRKRNRKIKFDVEDFFKPFHSMNPDARNMIGPTHDVRQVKYSWPFSNATFPNVDPAIR